MYKNVTAQLYEYRPNSRSELDTAVSFVKTRPDQDSTNAEGGTTYERYTGYFFGDDGKPMVVVEGKDPIGLISLNANVVDAFTGGDPWALQGMKIEVNLQDFLNAQKANARSTRNFPTFNMVFTNFIGEPTEEMKANRLEIKKTLKIQAWKERQQSKKDWRKDIAAQLATGERGNLPTQTPIPTLEELRAPAVTAQQLMAEAVVDEGYEQTSPAPNTPPTTPGPNQAGD